MSTQNQNKEQSSRQDDSRKEDLQQNKQQQPKKLSTDEQQDVKGGSGLLSGGNDLTNILEGNIGISNQSSGSDGEHSYTSQDSHNVDLGLGNMLDNTNY